MDITLKIGKTYFVSVNWDKFVDCGIRSIHDKLPKNQLPKNTTLTLVMTDFTMDQIDIFQGISQFQGNDSIKYQQNVLNGIEKSWLFYYLDEDRFFYTTDPSSFRVTSEIQDYTTRTFERINDVNFDRLKNIVDSENGQGETIHFCFQNDKQDKRDMIWSDIVSYINRANRIRNGGRFNILNDDMSIRFDRLADDILDYLKDSPQRISYKQYFQHKGKMFQVFPVNDWVFVEPPANPEIDAIGGLQGIFLHSDKLNITIGITNWNATKLLTHGFVHDGKLLGTYAFIKHQKRVVLIPSNSKAFEEMLVDKSCSEGSKKSSKQNQQTLSV